MQTDIKEKHPGLPLWKSRMSFIVRQTVKRTMNRQRIRLPGIAALLPEMPLPDEVKADVTRNVVGIDIGDVRCKSLRNHGILRRIFLCELIIALSLGGED